MMTFNEALKTLKQAAPVTLKVKTFRAIRVVTICGSDLLSCENIFRHYDSFVAQLHKLRVMMI